ncbi:methyltransferase domain-containing protein [Nocardia sp. NPDC056611]|uniref:methyltransferase domain-containing protein n=1 Tax=Nocardia sp. NPDC056611 TaxID=3345877 RepID=UPI00366FB81D
MNDNTQHPIVGTDQPSPADRLLACADLLACPQCGHPLTAGVDPAADDSPTRTLRCRLGHSYDLAKQGYVSLLTGASTKMTGDTPAMLDARAAFQSAGHFAPIAAALAAAIATPLPGRAADTSLFGADSPPAAAATDARPAPLREDGAATPTALRNSGTDSASRHHRARAGIATPGMSVATASAARLAATLLSGETAATGGGRAEAPGTPESPVGSRSWAGPDPAAESPTPVRTEAADRGLAVLEIGAGTGYYVAAVLDALPGARGIALDVSKAAARRAARAHVRAGSVLADAWRGLPVPDGVMSAVVSVFAPRNADEVARVLAEGGRFVVVTPTSRHLRELIEPLGMVSVDAAKEDRLAESLGERFELVGREAVEYTMSLTHEDVARVVAMGPSAFHGDEGRAEAVAALPDPVAVTASVTVSAYRPR